MLILLARYALAAHRRRSTRWGGRVRLAAHGLHRALSVALRSPKSRIAEGIGNNVRTIAEIEQRSLDRRSLGERLGDSVAVLAGTAAFAFLHVLWFSIWILVNVNGVPGVPAFDPYPFSFLTFIVSLEAIFLSIFVLVSQNRLTREADMRAHVDLQINLLAEQEATTVLRLLTRVCEHLGIELETKAEDRALMSKTDVKDIISELQDTLPARSSDETNAPLDSGSR